MIPSVPVLSDDYSVKINTARNHKWVANDTFGTHIIGFPLYASKNSVAIPPPCCKLSFLSDAI